MINSAVEGFINTVLKGYMTKDLEKLLDIPIIPYSEGNCNFPIALFTLSCMDFLGLLTSTEELNSTGDTGKRIEAYIKLAFLPSDKEIVNPYINDLVHVFRHGLSHEFFPKMAGISRGENYTIQRKNGVLILDADNFAKMFLRSLESLSKLMSERVLGELVINRYIQKKEDNKKYLFGETKLSNFSSTPNSMATVSYDPSLYKK